MNKKLNKAITTPSSLRNKYLKENSADAKIAHDKQRNYCVNLLRRPKNIYFANVNISSIIDYQFWKTVKPLLSDKISHKGTVNLVENDTNVSDEHVVTDNNYFNIIVKNFLTLTKRVFR